MRYAIISDVHANVAALRAVLTDAADEQVDKIICLGDVLGYGPEPVAALELVYRRAHVCLAGNHDDAVCGRFPVEDFTEFAAAAVARHRAAITHEAKDWLAHLPYTCEFEGFACAHGDFSGPQNFNYVLEAEDAVPSWEARTEQLLFVGHSHRPCIFVLGASGTPHRIDAADFTLEDGKRYIVNPGSVGYPRVSNGTCLSSYVIYDTSERSVKFRTIPFAVSSVMQRGMNRKSKALPLALAAFAAVAAAAATMLLFMPGGARPEADGGAGEKPGFMAASGSSPQASTADPMLRVTEKALTLPTSARSVRANLTLDRHSPPAQVEMTFLAADGSVLSHSSKPVKKSFSGEQKVPPGAVTVKFAVFRLPGCGEPRVKTFAPTASRPSP